LVLLVGGVGRVRLVGLVVVGIVVLLGVDPVLASTGPAALVVIAAQIVYGLLVFVRIG